MIEFDRIKIVSDGYGRNTDVFINDQRLTSLDSVALKVDGESLVETTLVFKGAALEVETQTELITEIIERSRSCPT